MKSLGLFLDKKSSEMKYIVQNSTEFSGLEFLLFENFVGFYSRKHLVFQLTRKTSTKMLAKTFNNPSCYFVIFSENI